MKGQMFCDKTLQRNYILADLFDEEVKKKKRGAGKVPKEKEEEKKAKQKKGKDES